MVQPVIDTIHEVKAGAVINNDLDSRHQSRSFERIYLVYKLGIKTSFRLLIYISDISLWTISTQSVNKIWTHHLTLSSQPYSIVITQTYKQICLGKYCLLSTIWPSKLLNLRSAQSNFSWSAGHFIFYKHLKSKEVQ